MDRNLDEWKVVKEDEDEHDEEASQQEPRIVVEGDEAMVYTKPCISLRVTGGNAGGRVLEVVRGVSSDIHELSG